MNLYFIVVVIFCCVNWQQQNIKCTAYCCLCIRVCVCYVWTLRYSSSRKILGIFGDCFLVVWETYI